MDEIAESLRRVSRRIDEHNADRAEETVTAARVVKLAEEAGEAVAAWLGTTGMNPRKGVTHTHAALQAEVLDVAVTALALWEHIDGHHGGVMDALAQHVRYLDERGLDRADSADRRTGQRDRLVAELRNIADGCMGSDRLRADAAAGIDRLADGHSSVRVGHTVYEVTDVSRSASLS